jgi:HSP20 family protein
MLPVLRNRWHTPTVRDELFSNFNSLFDDFFKDDFWDLVKSQGVTPSQGAYPRVDVIAFEDRIELESEIPGLKKDDVSVEVCDGVLTIKGAKRTESEEKKGGKVVFKELKRSSFQRSFLLDDSLDVNSVDAKFNDGILNVVIKKVTPTKVAPEVKKIEIK